MKNRKLITIIGILLASVVSFTGCDDITDQEKYQRPEWLTGKLYTQIELEEDLTVFAECLQITGLDTIINTSGSFTIFAPTNDAFNVFLAANPQYNNSINEIPPEELEQIVKFHILQDAWNRYQLQELDIEGWIDTDDPDNLPRAYKKQTVLKDPNQKVFIVRDKGIVTIVDSTKSNDYRMVFTKSRKYVPVFFPLFFSVFDLEQDDYQYYFNRPFDGQSLYYANGKVSEDEIFAENGFIYKIDQVVEPMKNARQLLESKNKAGKSYSSFLELINLFPKFQSNIEETYKQHEVELGLNFDTLYNLSYSGLPFDIHEELTGPNINDVKYSYMFHNGIFVPDDIAFQKLLDDVVTANSGYPHWSSFEAVPIDIKQIIVNTHLSRTPVYLSDIRNGFRNAYGNLITIDETNVTEKIFGSNCTFLGLNEAIVPKAFSSVTGPIYLRPGYSTFMYAMQYARVLAALTREEEEFMFFPISDQVFSNDSSLILIWTDRDANKYRFYSYDRENDEMRKNLSRNTLSKMILNQVGITQPDGIANKEFIETLGGNYLIWDNVTNTVQGGRPSVYGYNGSEEIIIQPVLLEEPTDNGSTYSVNGWFRNPRENMWVKLTGNYKKFTSLLTQAGLYNPQNYKFNFLTEGTNYTIFIPSDQALDSLIAESLSKEDLAATLKYHFVKGDIIFTDGKKKWADYETLRIDERSTEFTTVYSSLNIKPGPDIIEILDKDGNTAVTINESADAANIMVATDSNPDPNSNSELDFITTSVIHEIDKVLKYYGQ